MRPLVVVVFFGWFCSSMAVMPSVEVGLDQGWVNQSSLSDLKSDFGRISSNLTSSIYKEQKPAIWKP